MLIQMVCGSAAMLVLNTLLCYRALEEFPEQARVDSSCPTSQNLLVALLRNRHD